VVVHQHEPLARSQFIEDSEEGLVPPLWLQVTHVDGTEGVLEGLSNGHSEFPGLRVRIYVLPVERAIALDLVTNQVGIDIFVGHDLEVVARIGFLKRIEELAAVVFFWSFPQIEFVGHPHGEYRSEGMTPVPNRFGSVPEMLGPVPVNANLSALCEEDCSGTV